MLKHAHTLSLLISPKKSIFGKRNNFAISYYNTIENLFWLFILLTNIEIMSFFVDFLFIFYFVALYFICLYFLLCLLLFTLNFHTFIWKFINWENLMIVKKSFFFNKYIIFYINYHNYLQYINSMYSFFI